MLNISITKTTNPKAKPQDESKLGFGRIFTDHMFMMDYYDGAWHDARIVPFDYIPIHPASTVLHYGVEIFEGMKAYRNADGKIRMFRPIENARRMNNSAERLCLPEIPEEDFVQILDTLVELDKDWIPHSEGTSLYIRPFTYGNDEHLGVHPVKNATFCVILSPVGPYYAEGINPVKIAIESHDVRAVRGGTGYAKCGGNYAASLRAGDRAEKQGITQVLWLDGVERKYIEEVGSMNVMFMIDDEIITPELTGSVLPGITRKSCVELLKDKGYKVSERLISVDELITAAKEGRLQEAWGTGTAAVVSPIGWLYYEGCEYTMNGGKIGPVTQWLYDTLTAIQWGYAADTKHWCHEVCDE
ncbi:MAG: branched-chain amino acid aminotransferase [Lachnospiraceae bacterium]|nr:branched-chain amino acid aminotransferase [Lachnospiraceae bacterium]